MQPLIFAHTPASTLHQGPTTDKVEEEEEEDSVLLQMVTVEDERRGGQRRSGVLHGSSHGRHVPPGRVWECQSLVLQVKGSQVLDEGWWLGVSIWTQVGPVDTPG